MIDLNDKEAMSLFEDCSSHFASIYMLPPLAADIHTYLSFDDEEGVTFNELVEKLNASKSSISSNLNLLLQTKQIESFTKIGERKRYFRLSKEYAFDRMNEVLDKLNREKNLICRLKDYRLKVYGENIKTTGMSILIEHFSVVIKALNDAINDLKELRNN